MIKELRILIRVSKTTRCSCSSSYLIQGSWLTLLLATRFSIHWLNWCCIALKLIDLQFSFGAFLTHKISWISSAIATLLTIALGRAHFFILEYVFAVSTVLATVLAAYASLGSLRLVHPLVALTILTILWIRMAGWHMMVVFHKVVHWNYTVLVPFDLLENMICLNLCQNLDDSLLEASPSHQ